MKAAFKISLFALLLIGMNECYQRTAYPMYVAAHADQLLQVEKVKNCDIVYTSASSNFSPDEWNESKKKMSQFMAEAYPDMLVEAFNIPASHAGTHLQLLRRIPAESQVQTVVCAVNLRSMGADWINSELETALNQQAVMYADRPPLLNRLLVSLNAYDHKSVEERHLLRDEAWNNTPLPDYAPEANVSAWCAAPKWGDWRDPKRQLADQFIKQYAFVVDENNPRVQDFDQIAILAQRRGWNLVFSILPENVQLADTLVGKLLTRMMRENANWLEQRYKAMGVLVVNQLEALPSGHFVDKDFPTEHYDEAGRKHIAMNNAMALRKFHPTKYRNPTWSTNMNFSHSP